MAKLDQLKAELLPLVKKTAWLKLTQPIVLSSGKKSDRYFDGRKLTLHPKGMTLFARAILELIDSKKIDAVGGPSMGADPIATAVSLIAFLEQDREMPAFLIRKEPKAYGLKNQIEGVELKVGMNVLIVEDIITTGNSVLKAIKVVEGAGAKVVQIACLLDREEGADQVLQGYSITSLFNRKDVENGH